MGFQHLTPMALATLVSIFSMTANAHMIMKSPVPYGKSTLDNSPLIADGSDFPCKQRSGVYDLEGASNVMAVGSSNTLSFIGSAVHGGGSCQVSLTTDAAPTKDSKWMVVHSIEGGCPADVPGNLPADPNGTGAATFQYTIPDGIAPGDYTIAWSWVNKIGNREFYMNCGPATITAAKRKRYEPTPQTSKKRDTSFPTMFVANLQGVDNGCTTTEGVDILYPDPGSSVEKSSDGNFHPPVGCAGSAAQVSSGASGSSEASSATASAASVSASSPAVASSAGGSSGGSTASASVPSAAASASGAPGIFAPVSSSAPEATSAAAPSVASPVASAAPSSASPSSSGTTSSGTTPSASGAESGPCTDEGAWACSADGTSFQRCASGVWSPLMEMAAGTTCTPGVSNSLNMTGRKTKRSMHASHVRRSHRAWGVASE